MVVRHGHTKYKIFGTIIGLLQTEDNESNITAINYRLNEVDGFHSSGKWPEWLESKIYMLNTLHGYIKDGRMGGENDLVI